MYIARFIFCIVVAFGGSHFVYASDTGVLEGMLIQAFSINAGVAVAAAFYFLQNSNASADKTVLRIEAIRLELRLSPLSQLGKDDIRERFRLSAQATFRNAIAIIVLVAVYSLAVVYGKVQFERDGSFIFGWCSKLHFIYGVAISCFLISLCATYDIVATSYVSAALSGFALGEASEKVAGQQARS